MSETIQDLYTSFSEQMEPIQEDSRYFRYLFEMAQASGVGMDVDFDAVPIPPESQALCAAYGLDPLGVIASGQSGIVLGSGLKHRGDGMQPGIACGV